jgi:four helix bundle protein
MLTEENNLYHKSFVFAVQIVKLYRYLIENKKEYVLSKQLLRSGTSVGANIAEANGAISKADFSSKLSIAYKESLETKYWLSLLKETEYLDQQKFDSTYSDIDELCKILFSVLRTTRINPKQSDK